MNWKLLFSAGLGLLVVAVAFVVALVAPGPSSGDVPLMLAVVLGLVVFGASVVKLVRTPDEETTAPAPWTESGALVEERPESTPERDRISGTELSETIRTAAAEVRGAETFEPGLEIVREPLRDALVRALRQGGWSETRIDEALAAGTWTDDPVAASVLDERVQPPERSLRRRLWAWLFPERALRHRTALAVGAVARAAESALPAVVGQRAPRPVPVPEPTVDDLQRAADGELRQAVEGRASVRPSEQIDSGSDAVPGTGETTTETTGESRTDAERGAEPPEQNTLEATDGDWPVAGGGDG